MVRDLVYIVYGWYMVCGVWNMLSLFAPASRSYPPRKGGFGIYSIWCVYIWFMIGIQYVIWYLWHVVGMWLVYEIYGWYMECGVWNMLSPFASFPRSCPLLFFFVFFVSSSFSSSSSPSSFSFSSSCRCLLLLLYHDRAL